MKKLLQRFVESKHLAALSDAMMIQLGIIVIGSFFLILANPPVNPDIIDYQNANIFVKFLCDWKEWAVANYSVLTMPFNFTMGIIGLLTSITVSYMLASRYRLEPLIVSLMSASIFLTTSVIAIDGGYDLTYLSADGMFYAILVGFIVADICKLLDRDRFKMKLDPAIPSNVAGFINSLFPFIAILIVFYIPYVIIFADSGYVLPQAFMSLIAPSIDIVSSFWGFLIILTFSNLLWFFGINGLSIVFPILFTTCLNVTLGNAEAIANGMEATNPMNIEMFRAALVGGSGNTIGLAILMMRSRSKKLGAVGKVAFIPSIFGINEPIIFGGPIVFNPYLIVPFIVAPIISVSLCYLGQVSGILTIGYLVDPSFIPFFAQAYLNSLSIINVLFSFVIVGISYLIYLPFFKAYEKQELRNEQQL